MLASLTVHEDGVQEEIEGYMDIDGG
jgi:hypothetical protein